MYLASIPEQCHLVSQNCLVALSLLYIKYSGLSVSRPRLSRITAYLEVKILSLPKHENLPTSKKYCGKEERLLLRSNFSSFPQYFRYISNFKSPVTYKFVKCSCLNSFSSIFKIWYVEVWISRSILESPLDFEITGLYKWSYPRMFSFTKHSCPKAHKEENRNKHPVSILHKSIAGRYRPVRVADGPITARCRFMKNASWAVLTEMKDWKKFWSFIMPLRKTRVG